MKKILILFALISNYCFAQHIVWEAEYDVGAVLTGSHCPVIVDSEGNIVCTVDDSNSPFINSYFFKYGPEGVLKSFRDIYTGLVCAPLHISENDTGYSLFCGASFFLGTKDENYLPMILNIDKNGDTLSSKTLYDLLQMENYKDNSFKVSYHKNTVKMEDNKYYNAFVKNKILINETTAVEKNHLIFNCFDKDGRIILRRGFDTLGLDDNSQFKSCGLVDFTSTLSGTFIALLMEYRSPTSEYVETNVRFLEWDSAGDIIKTFERQIADTFSWPIEIIKLYNGSYIIMGSYALTDDADYFFWKIDYDGKIEKEIEIPRKNLYSEIRQMSLAPDGNIIVFGYTLIEDTFPDAWADNKYRLYMYKISPELDILWEYEWYEHEWANASNIQDIVFLDNDNFIVTGYKDRTKFYIAKINQQPEAVEIGKNDRRLQIAATPSPFSNFCEISIDNLGAQPLEAAIYDAMGNKVRALHSGKASGARRKSFLINGNGLAPGVYFVHVNYGGKVFVEKIVRE